MRPLTEAETPLVAWLVESACRSGAELLQVETMNDGGMGSMRISPFDSARSFGETIAEALFEDEDGTPVVASLNVDTRGQLSEVDIWRVDFEPLKRWPDVGALSRPSSNPLFKRTPDGAA